MVIAPLIARTQNAYIVNYFNNQVAVVDLSTHTVTSTIGVQLEPQAIAVNPSGTRVYVCNFFSWTVSVIDATTNVVIATIPVGGGPQGIAVNPAGTFVYVANLAGTVSVIDASSNTVTATVTVGDYPRGIVAEPSGDRVFVANLESFNISVINTTTNTVIHTIPAGLGPYALAINQAGTLLYVTEVANVQGGPYVVVKDLSTYNNVALISVGFAPYGLAISPDDTRVYVSHWDWPTASVTVIDAISNTIITSIPVGGNALGIDLNGTGSRVYVVCELDELVYEIDAVTNAVLSTFPAGPSPTVFGNFIGPDPPTPVPSVPLSDFGILTAVMLVLYYTVYRFRKL